MLLDGALLKYQLSKEFDFVYHEHTPDIKVDRPIFFENAKTISGHIVLISESDDIQIVQTFPDVVFICLHSIDSVICNKKNNYIVINNATTNAKVFNALLDIFEKFNTWEKKMNHAINQFAGFTVLIDSCDDILDDPLALIDNHFNYVGYSRKLARENGFETKYVDQNFCLPLDSVNQFNAMSDFKELEKIKNVFQYTCIEHMLHKNIYFNNTYVGRLALPCTSNEEKNAYYRSILNHISEYIELLYSRYGSFKKDRLSQNLINELLAQIIEGKNIDLNRLIKLFTMSSHQVGDEYYLIQLKTNFTKDAQIQSEYMAQQFELHWPGICCIIKDSYLLLLVNITLYNKLMRKEFFQELACFLRESLLIAGISRKFTNFEHLKSALAQTAIAIKLGGIKDPTYWYFKFDDYSFDYLLRYGQGDFIPDQICCRPLVTLKNYDEKENTPYFNTLYVFVKNRYNAVAAAKKLYIARSSFLNRLERIIALTHFDLDNWEERLYLELSYLIYFKYEKETQITVSEK
ncbi:helix-turn-helix domain-containing protein [Dehalobacter sp. DCM]|uniref:PucR family transcriptional regulator n=1 Tax=Dehalobacter sp. DCM TaxID=2907827 RepID=UPI003081F90C|nr:helix-turn-helix domain-containing protein [Dehalobacter sp. DCM]